MGDLVHRKDIITYLQTQPTSAIPIHAVFKGFFACALSICSSQHIQGEIAFLNQLDIKADKKLSKHFYLGFQI